MKSSSSSASSYVADIMQIARRMDEMRMAIDKLNMILVGDGKPEDGLIFRLLVLEKQIEELREKEEKKEATNKAILIALISSVIANVVSLLFK